MLLNIHSDEQGVAGMWDTYIRFVSVPFALLVEYRNANSIHIYSSGKSAKLIEKLGLNDTLSV